MFPNCAKISCIVDVVKKSKFTIKVKIAVCSENHRLFRFILVFTMYFTAFKSVKAVKILMAK